MNERHRHPLHGLRPPGAPPGLRRRTLDAARAVGAAPAQEPERSLTDRAWESRPLRLAWAAGLALLIGANLYLDYLDRGAIRAAPEARLERAATIRGAAPPSAPSDSRTLLAARGEVLHALLGDPLGRGGEAPTHHEIRRTP